MKKWISLILVLLFCLLPLSSCGDGRADLEVLFLSVGKADAILLRTKEHTVLIDTGYEESYSTIKTALTREGVSHIDHMILTHFDKDHIGSSVELLSTCSVGNVYLPNYEGTGGKYAELSDFLRNYRGDCTRVTEAITLTLDGFTFHIDPTSMTSLEPEDDNDYSLIVSVKNKTFSLLLMGDAEKARVTEYARRDTTPYDVIKLPHHGDYFKDLVSYINTVSPAFVIHSCEIEAVDTRLDQACEESGIRQFITGEGPVRLRYDAASDITSVEYD